MIKPVFNDVNICLAGNENYAEPMRNMIYSILLHADKSRRYEFIILTSGFSDETKRKFDRFKADNVDIRFIDMTFFREKVKDRVKSYISAETNYRLYLFSEDFSEYDRMLYLDCDMQAADDITKLYDTDLEDKAIGACEECSFRILSVTKRAIFFDKKPCNIDIYRSKYLQLSRPEKYFNAGMVLLDLKKCREITDDIRAVEVLSAHKMFYNDQDTLNILFNKSVKLLDIRWNYSIAIELAAVSGNEERIKLFKDLIREGYGIIHYTGSEKPWNSDIILGEVYKRNYNEMIKEEITDEG